MASAASNSALLHAARGASGLLGVIANARTWLVTSVLFVLGLLVRIGDLDAMVNVDMYHLWSARTVRFVEALRTGELAGTYQSHHPGVTLMWLMGGMWSITDMVSTPLRLHPEKVRLAVWPIVVVGASFSAVAYPVLVRLFGERRRFMALVACLLLCTEPLLVAHARNPHLDVLAVSFSWLAGWCALIAKRDRSVSWASLAGVLLGLALASKVSTVGIALGIALAFGVTFLLAPRRGLELLPPLAVIVVVSGLTLFVCWPALWVDPIGTLVKQYEGLSTEVGKTGAFMLMGRAGKFAVPAWIYGVFVAFLVTPELWVPGLLLGAFAFASAAKYVRRIIVDQVCLIAPLSYLILDSTNVGVRNTILWLPFFAVMTGLVAEEARQLVLRSSEAASRGAAAALVAVLLVGRVVRLVALFPLPLAYCSSLPQVDCATVFHVGWGEGLREAARFIEQYSHQRDSDRRVRVYGSAYAPIVKVWADVEIVKKLNDADLLVDYAPDWLRRIPTSREIAKYVKQEGSTPLFTVRFQERDYVRIYRGPGER